MFRPRLDFQKSYLLKREKSGILKKNIGFFVKENAEREPHCSSSFSVLMLVIKQ